MSFKDKLITDLKLSEEKAALVMALIRGKADPTDAARFPKTADWVRSCYNRPRQNEMVMAAIDETISGHGVEGTELPTGKWISYSNMGDPYIPTIVLQDDCFLVACWGDVVEEAERDAEADAEGEGDSDE